MGGPAHGSLIGQGVGEYQRSRQYYSTFPLSGWGSSIDVEHESSLSEAALYRHLYLCLSSRPGTRPGSSFEFEVRGRIPGGFLASEPASHSLGMIRRGMRWANAVKIHPGASANRDNSNQWPARDAESRFVHESLPRQPISTASRSTVTCACST